MSSRKKPPFYYLIYVDSIKRGSERERHWLRKMKEMCKKQKIKALVKKISGSVVIATSIPCSTEKSDPEKVTRRWIKLASINFYEMSPKWNENRSYQESYGIQRNTQGTIGKMLCV